MLFAHIKANFSAAFYPRLSEWVAAFVTLLGGLVLLHNDALMAASPRGYTLMLSVATQETWAFMFTLLGFTRIIILLINGALRRSPHLRALTAFISCGIWTSIFLSLSVALGLGFIMALGYLAMDYLNIVRAMRDARLVDDTIREQGSSGKR